MSRAVFDTSDDILLVRIKHFRYDILNDFCFRGDLTGGLESGNEPLKTFPLNNVWLLQVHDHKVSNSI